MSRLISINQVKRARKVNITGLNWYHTQH